MRDNELGGNNPLDAEFAKQLDDITIEKWERFYDATVGTRKPEDLTVCYLCGPEPQNDFDELVKLGIHPHNIWAFESDPSLFEAAVRETRGSEFQLLKIVRGPIEQFFINTPKRFDIIYLDACAPLPSISQHTLRMVACALRHHRLASPGVLITNFSMPADVTEHVELVAANLYPRSFLEYAHSNGEKGFTEGPVSQSLSFDEFLIQVAASFDDYYGQYITRQLFDLGCLIVPWVRTIDSPQWPRFFNRKPKEVAAASAAMANFDSEDKQLSGLAITDIADYSIQSALRSLSLIQPSTGSSTKLAKAWLQQMQGLPPLPASMDASTAMLCHDVLASTSKFHTDTFATALNFFANRNRLFQFCDVPTDRLAFDLLISQFAYPFHYVTDAVRRWTYVAKATRMFLDVIVFDEARYIYDWMPLAELVEYGVRNSAQQLSYRFALDGLVKNRRWYNKEIFFGGAIVDQSDDGFEAKVLHLREEVTISGASQRPRIAAPIQSSGR